MGIDGVGAEAAAGAGGEIVIARGDVHVVQLARGADIRCDQNAAERGTLRAVAGHASHRVHRLAGTLGHKGGGAAAVAVDRPFTAQCQHGLAELIAAEADGVVRTAAVVHHEHKRAVFLDADHGTGRRGGGTFLFLAHKHAVLDRKVEVRGDCMQAVGRNAVAIGVELAGDLAGVGILNYGEEGLRMV